MFIDLYLLLLRDDDDHDNLFLQEHHTALSFKSCHSSQAQLVSAHAAIFNPGGTWLTIRIASKSGTLHFFSRIH